MANLNVYQMLVMVMPCGGTLTASDGLIDYWTKHVCKTCAPAMGLFHRGNKIVRQTFQEP